MTVDQLKPTQLQRCLDFLEPVKAHAQQRPTSELSIHGVEKAGETRRLCRLNLAVHGPEGEIKQGGNINSYYDNRHEATGRFNFVLANPPFSVDTVDTAMRVSARRHPERQRQDLPERQDHERLKDMVGLGRPFPFGLPRNDNENYLGINSCARGPWEFRKGIHERIAELRRNWQFPTDDQTGPEMKLRYTRPRMLQLAHSKGRLLCSAGFRHAK